MAGDVAVTGRVIARNNIGRFIADCEQAAGESVNDLINEGADLSRAYAPVGHKVDLRTPTLKAAMFTHQLSRTQGVWGNSARHALPTEFGAGPHIITGSPSLAFFWEGEGRNWIPAAVYYHHPGLVDVINHPGNPAQPFLRPAFEAIKGRALAIMRRHYPS